MQQSLPQFAIEEVAHQRDLTILSAPITATQRARRMIIYWALALVNRTDARLVPAQATKGAPMALSPQATRRYPMRCYYCAEVTYAAEVARVVNRPAPRRRDDGTSVIYT